MLNFPTKFYHMMLNYDKTDPKLACYLQIGKINLKTIASNHSAFLFVFEWQGTSWATSSV